MINCRENICKAGVRLVSLPVVVTCNAVTVRLTVPPFSAVGEVSFSGFVQISITGLLPPGRNSAARSGAEPEVPELRGREPE